MSNATKICQALPILLASILTACAYQPLTLPPVCASFTASYWAEFNFNADSPADVVSTVSRLWGIDQDELRIRDDRWGKPHAVFWGNLDSTGAIVLYTAWFRDGTLRKIDVAWREHPAPNPALTQAVMSKPSLSQAVDCLGAPDYYVATYEFAPEAVRATLDLLYPQKGLVVRYGSPFTDLFTILGLQREFLLYKQFEQLAVVAPGTPEQMVPAVYSVGNVAGGNADNACLSKPWPGSFEALEFVLGLGFKKGADDCESSTLEELLREISGTPMP